VTGKVFFDTNIFVYLFVDDEFKADRAESIIAGGGVVSVQVLNEFIAVTRGKYRLSWAQIEASLAAIEAECTVIPLDLAIHRRAVTLCRTTHYSIYDGLILAAALHAGCDTLYSEDMQHGRQIEGLTILNPFQSA
jgi:predicted nucleic acid-binding protein